jgi:hypothetical protein
METHPMWTRFLPVVLTIPMLLAGCGDTDTSPPAVPAGPKAADGDATIRANLAQLSTDDRKLAEEQQYCAKEPESRLGSMGVPVKIVVNDEPVFVCCKGCKAEAQAHPEETLAKAKQLKAKHAPTSRE